MTEYDTFSVDQINNGDLLKVNGLNDKDEEETWYAEKVGVTKEGDLEVYFMSPTLKNNEFKYDDHYSIISIETVLEHVPNTMGYKIAWKKLGFIKISKTKIIKMKSESESESESENENESEKESDSESDDSELESDLGGFIVPDDESFCSLIGNDNNWIEDISQSNMTQGSKTFINCINNIQNSHLN